MKSKNKSPQPPGRQHRSKSRSRTPPPSPGRTVNKNKTNSTKNNSTNNNNNNTGNRARSNGAGSASPVGRRRVLRGTSTRGVPSDSPNRSNSNRGRSYQKGRSTSAIDPNGTKQNSAPPPLVLGNGNKNRDGSMKRDGSAKGTRQPKRKGSLPVESATSNRPPMRRGSLNVDSQPSKSKISSSRPDRVTSDPTNFRSQMMNRQRYASTPRRLSPVRAASERPYPRSDKQDTNPPPTGLLRGKSTSLFRVPSTRGSSHHRTSNNSSSQNSQTSSSQNNNNNNNKNGNATQLAPPEAINENSSSHIRRNNNSNKKPKIFRRWNFCGGKATDDEDGQQRHDANDDSSAGSYDSFGGKREPVAENDESDSSEWDSDADEDYMIRNQLGGTEGNNNNNNGNGNSLPPPNLKRQQRRERQHILFPNDQWWQRCLRHFRILPPIPNEGRTRRSIRRLIWATLILDVLVAVVSIATFGESVTMCCGQATMASIPSIDWNLFMEVIAYIYLIGIFLEIHPVVREGPIPWNLLNPIFGTALSFAVFVDDSKAEAISLWIMEFTSIVLECITYQKLKKLYHREARRLTTLDDRLRGDQDALYRKGGQYKKNAYLRERRILRVEHAENRSKLRYHFVGVTVNLVLVGLTLLLMIFVARGGGMCLVGGEGLDIFHPDQKSRCFKCFDQSDGWTQQCENCTSDTEFQCYYPYF